MIRVGICGAGFVAQRHAEAYSRLDDVKIAAIADPRAEYGERLAGRYGAAAVSDLDSLLAHDIDVVSVCTPPTTHAALACAAMRAGKHVLCEKPIARSLRDAETMIGVAAETGVKLMVGHVARYEADLLAAHEIVSRGEIGRLRMGTQSITGPFPEWSSGGWFANVAESGGPVLDLGIHSFDYFRWLFGSRVIRVSAVGAESKVALPSYVLVTLRFENGGMALVEVSWAHPKMQGLFVRNELVGTEGRIYWDYDTSSAVQLTRDDRPRRNQVLLGDIFGAEIADFIHCVRADTAPPISGEEGLEALRIGLAALESLESGRTIALGEEFAP